MFLRSNIVLSTAVVIVFLAVPFLGQADTEKKADAKPSPSPTPALALNSKDGTKVFTAEQIADSAIFIYGFGGGRTLLDQIRKTTTERGKSVRTNADGKVENISYTRYILRGPSLAKDKIRLDQEFPNARYSLVKNEDELFGVVNNTKFVPSDEAAKRFEDSIFHGIEALLRFKEDESKIELSGREKIMGVDLYVIDVTDKKDRKTRFYVSVKSLRIMQLDYEFGGVKYKRKFYNHNYAQGTLVPFRSTLTANGKVIEETEIGTVTFGQKVEEDLFKSAN
ncbi:MAG: hypothetical protein IPK01_16365 [Acidobacteria bacterium]|nr:hypothetical protein [Acidobacteriota bacterium]